MPVVDGWIVLVPPDGGPSRRPITFRLDFASAVTVLTAEDLRLDPIPLDDLSGSGHRDVASAISFRDNEMGPITYLRQVRLVNGEAAQSRLGRDVLSDWITFIDFSDETVVLQPHNWEMETPPG